MRDFFFLANYNIHIGLIHCLQPMAFGYEILCALIEVLAFPVALRRGRLLKLSHHVEGYGAAQDGLEICVISVSRSSSPSLAALVNSLLPPLSDSRHLNRL